MNGTRYILDTNAMIFLLKGNSSIDSLLFKADYIAASVISFIEFLSFPDLDAADKNLFFELINRITLISVSAKDRALLEAISKIRKNTTIKLPDAIIAGTAIYNDAVLITNDKDFSKIPLLQTVSF